MRKWTRTQQLCHTLRAAADLQAASASGSATGEVQSDYQQLLHSSRSFASPDAVEAMATAYSVLPSVEFMQGSVMSAPRSEADQAALAEVRQSLKRNIQAAWSQEAVRRGVALAKEGKLVAAHKCYQQALDLDRRNVDAWVARGAAHANSHAYQKAAQDFETALELEPRHANAAKYLAVTRQRMQAAGLTAAALEPASGRTQHLTPVAHPPHRLPARSLNAGGAVAPGSAPSRLQTQKPDQAASNHGLQAAAGKTALPSDRSPSGSGDSSSSSGQEDSDRSPRGAAGHAAAGAAMDLQKAMDIVPKHLEERQRKSKHKRKKRRRASAAGDERDTTKQQKRDKSDLDDRKSKRRYSEA
ncbi:hypothetical protein WJX72_001267 [[Myrmecia] bisecta]|uniref:Uncharacterized protein n=1 Tax=[Myrmecia] bisecta TaxID=41462 RepID=A0AAW1QPA2_9CHLO